MEHSICTQPWVSIAVESNANTGFAQSPPLSVLVHSILGERAAALPPRPITRCKLKFVPDTTCRSYCLLVTDDRRVWLRHSTAAAIIDEHCKFNEKIRAKSVVDSLGLLRSLLEGEGAKHAIVISGDRLTLKSSKSVALGTASLPIRWEFDCQQAGDAATQSALIEKLVIEPMAIIIQTLHEQLTHAYSPLPSQTSPPSLAEANGDRANKKAKAELDSDSAPSSSLASLEQLYSQTMSQSMSDDHHHCQHHHVHALSTEESLNSDSSNFSASALIQHPHSQAVSLDPSAAADGDGVSQSPPQSQLQGPIASQHPAAADSDCDAEKSVELQRRAELARKRQQDSERAKKRKRTFV